MRNMPKRWKLINSIIFGAIIGLSAYIFIQSNALSYLSDDPKTCINCHVMNSYYSSWAHSSHRRFTNCNECHVPHNNIVSKFLFKAQDGLRHATVFTLRTEPQVIYILEAGQKVVQENCIRCHYQNISNTSLVNATNAHIGNDKEQVCWRCHRELPHRRVNSLSSAPNAILNN